ncbi:23S rRNA pseudouridine955/2504/2580 synthase [Sporobacter termitidis DSM 10068]|uniref:Pseudouridine synthase n=1 Tax=Sporobacter termitidis DSM 10068 TaxID=1123282 RepID=A0A1M5X0N8_9FIRM|nr:RluA family pseudouridine synthase [Sporobacter termitidis]SHH93429.1 23S rRNA pseudouridine955/2504/2580 synthase [Sporobacter termitidis DSM 10068]
MKEFTIEKNDAGQRLDRFVTKTVPLLPASLLQKYIRLKRIKLNGKGAKQDAKLALGDNIQMYINDEFFEAPSEENAYLKITEPQLDIVYEDENILLVNKKAGVLCHSDGAWSYNTLIAHIQAYLYAERAWRPREENAFAPALCNRIDRNTQGIVIAAKNAEALRVMNEKIKNREVEKYYLAVVSGPMRPAAGKLEGYIFKDAVKNQVFVSDRSVAGSKTAVTEYRTLAVQNGLSLLECRLITGRTHQIRAQLSHAGHPLLGDGKYGSGKTNRQYGENGQALCSYRLVFGFKTDAGILQYLSGREFKIAKVDFVEKYFNIN